MLYLSEMRPQWFDQSEVPFDLMWPDDYLWYPLLFSNKYFNGYFKFEGLSKMLEQRLTEIEGPQIMPLTNPYI